MTSTLRARSSVWNLWKMLVISLYWCADQQQTITCRRQKSGSLYSKFSVEWNELTPSFKTNRNWLKNCKDQILFQKPRCTISGSKVKSVGGKSGKIPQIRFFRRYLIHGFSPKMISIKSVFTSNLSFLTLKTRSLIWNLWTIPSNFVVQMLSILIC